MRKLKKQIQKSFKFSKHYTDAVANYMHGYSKMIEGEFTEAISILNKSKLALDKVSTEYDVKILKENCQKHIEYCNTMLSSMGV